ncbi:hypothetical protein DBR34_19275, partial [Stenotrophomonas sp. HMWF003]
MGHALAVVRPGRRIHIQHRQQLRRVQRFVQHRVHAAGTAALYMRGRAGPGERQQPCRRAGLCRLGVAQQGGQLVAAHVLEVAVDQHHRAGRGMLRPQGAGAVATGLYRGAQRGQL